MQNKLLITLFGLLLASCGKSSDSKSKPTDKTANASDARATLPPTTLPPKSKASAAAPNTTPPSFVTKPVSNQSRLSLDIDFENVAEDKVNKANYKAELSVLEQSIGQQAAKSK